MHHIYNSVCKAITVIAAILAVSIILFNFILGTPTIAQKQGPEPFSEDHQVFIDQIDAVFNASNNKQKAREYMQELSEFFKDPATDVHVKDDIIAMCNLLRKVRAVHAFPEYAELIEIVRMSYTTSWLSKSNKSKWHNALVFNLTNSPNTRRLNKFVRQSFNLFSDGIIGYSSSSWWKVPDRSAIRFEWENNKFNLTIEGKGDKLGTTLMCQNSSDSIEIFDTHGFVDFEKMQFSGVEGRITWERVGLPADQAFATFGKYNLDLTKLQTKIDDAHFVNTDYFKQELVGTIEHRLISLASLHGKSYPKFTTTRERREVKQIFKDMDYLGGFAQEGNMMRGSQTEEGPAELFIYRKDTLFLHVKSKRFTLYPNRIESASARVSFKLYDRELMHPGLHFSYLDNKRLIRLTRMGEDLENSRYFDTYHMVNMDVQQLEWPMESDAISLGMVEGAARAYATFESIGYYREEYYNKLQGMDFTHPFQHIADFYRYTGGQPFHIEDYAQFRGLSPEALRYELITFSYDGFVDFDATTEVITPNPRLFDYLKYRLGKKDYDVIRFDSDVKLVAGDRERVLPGQVGNAPNAVLDLKNYDIQIFGVKGIAVSDYQNVALRPKNNTILLKRNRDFQFDGEVEAGMLNLFGEGFYFSYDKFRIDLKRVDKLCINVTGSQMDRYGQIINDPIKNTIRDVTGFIEIDKPDNKSGRYKYEGYPRLTSEENSMVYYDHPSIQGGKYKKDKVYFTVDPFVFEDINNITPQNTSFDGVFTSGIFPDIREKLVIRPDLSLGFVRKAPEEGYPIYGGIATYHNDIDLSWKGILGNGEIEYISSRSTSPDFTFLPDEALGVTTNFNVQKKTSGITYPGVELGENTEFKIDGSVHKGQTSLTFRPFEARLTVTSTKGKFRCFPNADQPNGYECEVGGELSVTPKGLIGHGRIDIDTKLAKLEAMQIHFTDHTVETDTSFFRIEKWSEKMEQNVVSSGKLMKDVIVENHNVDEEDESSRRKKYYEKEYRTAYAHAKGINEFLKEEDCIRSLDKTAYNEVMSKRLLASLDFETRKGSFRYALNEGEDFTMNPIRYETKINNYTWDMPKNEITIGVRGSDGNLFFCNGERGYDNEARLNFKVPVATWRPEHGELYCEEVKTINTADAVVKLLDKEGKMTIRASNKNKAKIDRISNVEINIQPLDSAGKAISQHLIYNAKVDINGAQTYDAWGDYDFINANKKKYTIYMDSIHTVVEKKVGTTHAWGRVGEDITFDEWFAFKGRVGILAGRQLLEYRGGARPIHNSPHMTKGYVYFESVIDPYKVRIPIGQRTVNIKKGEINRGFYITYDSAHIYSSYIEVKKGKGDDELLSAQGVLYRNKIQERFDILPEYAITRGDTAHQRMSFYEKKHMIEGEGSINMRTRLPLMKNHGLETAQAGEIRHEREVNDVTLNLLWQCRTRLSNTMATQYYNQVMTANLPKCDTTSYRYERRMNNLFDTTTIQNIKANRWRQLEKDPKTQIELLPALNSVTATFTFDDVVFKWNTERHSYICDTTVKLMMIMDRNVNRKVRLKCEIKVRKDQSKFDMYIDLGNEEYLYCKYDTKLLFCSSNKDINSAMTSERNMREYTVASPKQVQKFLDQFNSIGSDPDAEESSDEAPDDAENEE